LTIGLVIPDISNPFFSQIARRVESVARKNGYSTILCDSEDDVAREMQSIDILRQQKVDGLIVSTVGQSANHLVNVFQKGIPMVIVDRVFPDLGLPFVTSDSYQGSFDAISYLIENGHQVIACVQGLLNTFPNTERVRGYMDAHHKYNLPVDESLIVGDSYGKQNGYIEMKLLLQKKKRPTAVFSCSNLISLGILQAISEEGLKVPEDVSIISFDEQPYSSFLATPMTTVLQQTEEMGSLAVRLLIDQINARESIQTRSVFLPTKMIIRDSVKSMDEHISEPVLRAMRENNGVKI
jgi:LacI family transcriptional regulator